MPYPIAELPAELKSDHHKLLLFCGARQQGWRLGVWLEDGWRDFSRLDQRLEPSHFALATGLEAKNGQWFHTRASRRLMLGLVGGLGLAFMATLGLGQLAYGDPWAICAPGRTGSGAGAAAVNPSP